MTNEMISKKNNILGNLIWSLRYINDYDPKFIAFSLSFSVVTGIVPPILLLLTQQIINGIQLAHTFTHLLELCFLYIGIDIMKSSIAIAFNYYQQKFSRGFNLHMNQLILEKATRLTLSDFENSEIYDKINRAQGESNGKLVIYVSKFVNVFASLLSIVSYTIILISFSPKLMLLILFIPLVKFVVSRNINIERFILLNARTHDSRKTWYIQYLLTYGLTFKELKINNLFSYFIEKYKGLNKRFIKQDLKVEKKNAVYMSVILIIESMIDLCVLGYIVLSAVSKHILIGNVTSLLSSISQIKQGVTVSLQTLSDINKESLFIDQIRVYFEIDESHDNGSLEIDSIDCIEVRDLSFKYKDSLEYTLKDVNFKINRGESVVIVGQNGSGKTTLLKILAGLYTDYEGKVLINDHDIKEINKRTFHRKISIIFQDFIHYEGTFRENIGYGNLCILEDTKTLEESLRKFDLYELVKDSRNKIDTQIGHWFDNGIQISAGQWQKLSICRAYVKEADLMIFDEPNSALDPVSELRLAKLYKSMMQDKIGIIIAHNFKNFVKEASSIIVFQNGSITNVGSHDDLIMSDEEYKKLFNIQVGNM